MNAISWFAIPVQDLERARAFYCAIFGYEKMDDLVTPMGTCAIFPFSEDGGVGGFCRSPLAGGNEAENYHA